MKPGAYFAHPMSDYGTDWERDAIRTLRELFKGQFIYNPAEGRYQDEWKIHGMSFFDNHFLPKINALAFTRFPNYQIGSGVAYEILSAWTNGVPVYDFERDPFTLRRIETLDEIAQNFCDRRVTRALIRRYRNGV